MQCGQCAGTNPDGHRFCGHCGAPLGRQCPTCHADLPPGHRFCGHCGASVDTEPAAAVAPEPVGTPPVSERRLVSVLFVDLVGFTTLSEQSDPEVVRDLQSEYFEQARTVVARYGGTVEKFIGDAVVAVWGTPVAREDDAERAVRAGLDLLDAVSALGEQRADQPLRARAGVATGQAAVRLDAVDQGMVTGDVVNSAARIQTIAEPGALWVDDATREASSRAITYAVAGDHELKGRTQSVRLFAATQVVAGSGGAQRFDGLEAPFAGRERDLRVIKELFHDSVEQSRARLVVVTGVAGVGKSRLGWEFFKYVDGISQLCSWHVGRCLSYGEGVAYWALAEMVRMRLRITDGEPESVAVGKLDAGLDEHVPDAEERAWLRPRLAVLLGLARAGGVSGADLDRDTLFAGWRLFLERLAASDPVVLVFEDMQHADAGLLDFVDHLLDWSTGLPIFVLALGRPELQDQRPAWGSHRSVTTLYLEPLPDDAVATIVDALVRDLPTPTRDGLAARAEGIPLFALETVRMLIDRDMVVPRGGEYVLADEVGDVEALDVPPTLQALVAARLDNLPEEERRLVKDAAVLGLSFTSAALAAMVERVGGTDLGRVEALLASLVRREVLTVQADARSPEAGQYRFEQKVMRTVAYETLSRHDRRARHLAAAAHLQAVDDSDDLAGVLATHYLAAADAVPDAEDADDLRASAVRHLHRAGDRARALAAPEEALRSFERALALAPDEDERGDLAEKAGLMARLTADVERAVVLLGRARTRHETAGRPLDVARVAAMEGAALAELDRLDDALALMVPAHDAVPAADRQHVDVALLANSIAVTHVQKGDMEAADPWLEQALATAEVAGAWEVLVRSLNAKAMRLVGSQRPVEARGLMQVALAVARAHDMPDRAALQASNLVGLIIGNDFAAAEELAREGVAHAARTGERVTQTFSAAVLAGTQLQRGAWDDIDQDGLRQHLRRLSPAYAIPIATTLVGLAALRGRPELLAGLDVAFDGDYVDQQTRIFAAINRALEAEARDDRPAALANSLEAMDAMIASGDLDNGPDLLATGVNAALVTGQPASARRLLDAAATQPPAQRHRVMDATIQWLEGSLAAHLGRPDEAEGRIEPAIAVLDDLGAPYWAARARTDLAEVLAGQGEWARAVDLASRALETFTELDAPRWVARAEELLDRARTTASH